MISYVQSSKSGKTNYGVKSQDSGYLDGGGD